MHQISEPPAGPAIEAHRPGQALRRDRGGRRRQLRGPRGHRAGRCSGPTGPARPHRADADHAVAADPRTARVAGHDVVTDPARVRRSMGLTGQSATVDELLTGRENLRLIGRSTGCRPATSSSAGTTCSSGSRSADAADRVAKTYSGGMRRRLDLAVSLVPRRRCSSSTSRPRGWTRAAALELWDVLRELVADGTTLLLTTQYLEEADQLADHIVVIDHGRIIAEGTPPQLKDAVGGSRWSSPSPRADLARRADGPRGCCRGPRRPGSPPLTAPAARAAGTCSRSARPSTPAASARRPRAPAAQPRRRVPAPDRPPGRGHDDDAASPEETAR